MVPLQFKRVVHHICGIQSYFVATALYRVARGCERTYEEFLLGLPESGLLLDIGANLGVTVAFARRKRPDLRVVAFEPIPLNVATARRLWRVLRIDGVEFNAIALGDSPGMVEMVMPILRGLPAPGQTYVKNDECDYSSVLGDEGFQFTASVATLDSLQLPRVHGIKLDVENFEWHVLRGAGKLIERDHPEIYCELWDTPNRSKVMELLREYGYKCEKLDTKEDFLFQWSGHG
jgi:FkbM family methyltransferase